MWKEFLMRYPPWQIVVLVMISAAAIACGDTIINVPTTPSSATTSTTTPVVKNTIQFRVTGNAISARVRYSTPTDGLGQVVTSLPYFNTFSISGDSLFLSLEATPLGWGSGVSYPFLSIQIAVNNTVFREATSQDFLASPLSISGQWRQ